ncbi:RLF2 [[Candida] subhashii]|uniref:Structure-specific endonuclease subunit SLX4 n=1 Tax=[Candida] subhashii TaxID=561895 RepID=A0A8J5V1Y9_9ASCO|nr:RLF2 [[Candida] subhashii]KAG7664444.1 RLF2 [[Candida] subhashii]
MSSPEIEQTQHENISRPNGRPKRKQYQEDTIDLTGDGSDKENQPTEKRSKIDEAETVENEDDDNEKVNQRQKVKEYLFNRALSAFLLLSRFFLVERMEKKRKLEEEREEKRKKLEEEKEAKRRKLEDEKEAKRRKLEEEKEAKRKKLEDEKEARRKKLEDEKEAKRKKLEEEKQERESFFNLLFNVFLFLFVLSLSERLEKKQKLEEEKMAKELEKKRIEEEKRKAEELKERSQMKISSFFQIRPATPKKEVVAAANTEADSPVIELKKTRYQDDFLPFFVQQNVTMMKTTPSKKSLAETKAELDAIITRKESPTTTQSSSEFVSYLKSLKSSSNSSKTKSVTPEEIINVLNSSNTTEQQVLEMTSRLPPIKYISFYENLKPPYIGTWCSEQHQKQQPQIVKTPLATDITGFDYEYDSDLEWNKEDEEGEDLDDEDEEEEDVSILPDEEDEDFVENDNSGASRKKFISLVQQLFTLLLLLFDKKLSKCSVKLVDMEGPIDPFTNYWSENKDEEVSKTTPISASTAPSSNSTPSDTTGTPSQPNILMPQKKIIKDPIILTNLIKFIELNNDFSIGTLVELSKKEFKDFTKGVLKSTIQDISTYNKRTSYNNITDDEDDHQQQESLYFHSTQMQSRHEDLLELEQQEQHSKQSVSRLNLFRNETTQIRSIPTKVETRKRKSLGAVKSTTKRKKKKNQSMSSIVRDQFTENKLSYFSGDQSKIDAFLKKLNKVEDLNQLNNNDNTASNTNNTSKLFSESEWNYILKSIKLKFPDLPPSNKMTLKAITRRIHHYENSLQREQNESIWSQACSHPETGLSSDDIKWLYDLDETQMTANGSTFIEDDIDDDGEMSPFVMTLSQNNPHPQDDETQFVSESEIPNNTQIDEIVSDSESDVEIIEVRQKKQVPVLQVLDTFYQKESSHQVSDLDPLISFPSFPFAPTITTPKKKSTVPATNPIVYELTGDSTITSPTTTTTRSSPIKGSQQLPIELLSSSQKENKSPPSPAPPSSSNLSPFKTPTKKSKQLLLSNVPSPLGNNNKITPTARSPYKLVSQSLKSDISPISNHGLFSTAKSSFDRQDDTNDGMIFSSLFDDDSDDGDGNISESISSSLPIFRTQIPRKAMRTTVVEVSGALKINDFDNHEIRLRKVSERKKKRVEVEEEEMVPDSEGSDDGGDVSIIEITRPVESDDDEEDDDEREVSILQVPASPGMEPQASSNLDIHLLTATELRNRFKTWGIKTVQGKDRMLEIITNINKLISPENIATYTTQSEFQSCIFHKLDELIREDQSWYDKILSFEPVRIQDLQNWLYNINQYELEYDLIRSYCDYSNITTTNTTT